MAFMPRPGPRSKDAEAILMDKQQPRPRTISLVLIYQQSLLCAFSFREFGTHCNVQPVECIIFNTAVSLHSMY